MPTPEARPKAVIQIYSSRTPQRPALTLSRYNWPPLCEKSQAKLCEENSRPKISWPESLVATGSAWPTRFALTHPLGFCGPQRSLTLKVYLYCDTESVFGPVHKRAQSSQLHSGSRSYRGSYEPTMADGAVVPQDQLRKTLRASRQSIAFGYSFSIQVSRQGATRPGQSRRI